MQADTAVQLATTRSSLESGGFSIYNIVQFVLVVWLKYKRQIMSTDAVRVRVIGITNIDALNNL
jgi:hypothetical protein